MRFAGKSLFAFGQLLVLRLPNIIVLMMLTRYQGADAAGLFSLAITYLILLTVWWVGLDELIIRETAKNSGSATLQPATSPRSTILKYGYARMSITALLYFAVVGVLWFSGVYDYASLAFITILLLSSITDGFTDAVQAGLYGHEQFNIAFAVSTIQATMRVVLVGTALLFGLAYLSVAWAWTVGSAFGSLAALTALSVRFPRSIPHSARDSYSVFIKRWVREGGAFLVIGILVTIEYQQDVIILSAQHSLSEVGYYGVATSIFAAVALPIRALRVALFPGMVKAAHDKDCYASDSPLVTFYAYAVRWTLAIGSICALLGFIYAGPLINLLFGPAMLPAIDLVRLLMVALVFFALGVPQSQYLLSTGQQNRTAILVTITVTINFIANLILVSTYGALGSSLARIISTTSYLFLALWSLFHYVNLPPWNAMVTPLISILPVLGFTILLKEYPWWFSAGISLISYTITYVTVSILTGDFHSLTVGRLSTTRPKRK